MVATTLWEKAKSSLFFIPAAFIGASAVLALVANRLDSVDAAEALPFLLPTSLAGARTLLASIAGATITVAALVFSMTAVTVQLAASQYSPRVLEGFLRDRTQQVVIGVVVGTFTFSLVSLATMGAGVRDAEGVFAAWAATLATGLGVATVVAIVVFVDHVTRRVRVDDIVRRLAAETATSMAAASSDVGPDSLTELQVTAGSEGISLWADRTGWVQRLDVDGALESLPAGSMASLSRPVGSYVVEGDELAMVWPAADDANVDLETLRTAIAIGETRTIGQDPAFGLRQLTDIALRALSPGVNDPATAADVVRHLAEPLRIALLRPSRRRVHRRPDGTRLLVALQQDHVDYLARPLAEIRAAAGEQPLVLEAMAETLASLRAQVARAGLDERVELIESQLEELSAVVAGSQASPDHMARARATLERIAPHLPSSAGRPQQRT